MDNPYQQHSGPSKQAAASSKKTSTQDRLRVAQWIKKRWDEGLTDEQMQSKLQANTQRPRRVELVERGLVIDSGKRRKTKAGKPATVWVWRDALVRLPPADPSLTAEEREIIEAPGHRGKANQTTKAELINLVRRVHRIAASGDQSVPDLALIATLTKDV